MALSLGITLLQDMKMSPWKMTPRSTVIVICKSRAFHLEPNPALIYSPPRTPLSCKTGQGSSSHLNLIESIRGSSHRYEPQPARCLSLLLPELLYSWLLANPEEPQQCLILPGTKTNYSFCIWETEAAFCTG